MSYVVEKKKKGPEAVYFFHVSFLALLLLRLVVWAISSLPTDIDTSTAQSRVDCSVKESLDYSLSTQLIVFVS